MNNLPMLSKHYRSTLAWLLFLAVFVWLLAYSTGVSAQTQVTGRNQLYSVSSEDSLFDIARRYGLGMDELQAANPRVDRWQPSDAVMLLLPIRHVLPPTPHVGIIINRPEKRLYLFKNDRLVQSYPVSIGRGETQTPTGSTHITLKRDAPTWVPPASIREAKPQLPEAVPPGPYNPLGDHALNLGWPGFVIHGTNRPWSIGKAVSHGCIRMYPRDIRALFAMVEVGTPVRIIDAPISLGWGDTELYLDVHPSEENHNLEDFRAQIMSIAGDQRDRINWTLIEHLLREKRGVATQITYSQE